VPVLGDDVDVGAHAQVLGPVRIGNGARLGALALVIEDVPPGGVAMAGAAVLREARRDPPAA
jgi:serine O-acetyltransferase